MAYEKLGFVSGQTLTADHMNHIEDGIANAGGSGGSGGGSVMKNIITQTEDYQMSANFTVADVMAQINAGVCPTLYIYQVADGMYVPCDGMSVTDEEIYFNYKQLHISADGSIWYDQ